MKINSIFHNNDTKNHDQDLTHILTKLSAVKYMLKVTLSRIR